MGNKESQNESFEEENMNVDATSSIWEMLTPKQKEYFLKLCEKNEKKLSYIG